jgi:hypothetical protein
MRIGHTKSGFRVFVSEDEYNMITHNGTKNCAYLDLSNRSAMNFLTIGDQEGVPNGRRVTFIHQAGSRHKYPELLQNLPKAYPATNGMPHFAPETVIWERETDVPGVRLKVARPPMKTPVNKGRGPSKKEIPATVEATPPTAASKAVQEVLEPVTREVREELSERSMRVSLSQAIDVVNEYKKLMGKSLELELTPKGYLLAQTILGGDPDDA